MTSCDAMMRRTGRCTGSLALAAGMLRFPHPLLGNDVNRQRVARRRVEIEKEVRAPGEEHEKGDQRGGRPADFPAPALSYAIPAVGVAVGAIADRECKQERKQQRRDE